jgi:two-component system, chemotaxis family, protein-glutamate methylesterase/glutaminase
MKKITKVLIVDDSPVKIKILEHILNSDSNIQVIGNAKNAKETISFIKNEIPDIITMDINIPGGINGFELTKLILNKQPIPIIIISAIRNTKNKKEISEAIMKSGALYFIDSPPGPWNENFKTAADDIIKQVKLLSNPDLLKKHPPTISNHKAIPEYNKINSKIILIGVSTGGPSTLREIISYLPTDFETPIVVAQHISSGFDKLLVNQLNKNSKLPIKIVCNHEKIKPGIIYFVPAGKITEVTNNEFVTTEPPKNYRSYLPSISTLFASVLSCYGKNITGVILTGMGADGVEELKMIKENGGETIAQDQASSIVYGMPKQAIERGAAMHIMNPKKIAEFLINFDKK